MKYEYITREQTEFIKSLTPEKIKILNDLIYPHTEKSKEEKLSEARFIARALRAFMTEKYPNETCDIRIENNECKYTFENTMACIRWAQLSIEEMHKYSLMEIY